VRQRGARFHLDIGAKPQQHVIEQRQLLVRASARSGEKKIADTLQEQLAALGIAEWKGVFKFVDERLVLGHDGLNLLAYKRRPVLPSNGMPAPAEPCRGKIKKQERVICRCV
jgi:hypothetical protein